MSVNSIKLEERARIDVLHSYGILDCPPDESVDALVRLASQICGTPIALVSLVDMHRQWFFSNIGLEVSQTPRDVAFCHHTIQGTELMEVQDALEDERFSKNPLVLGDPMIRFYAGAPLIEPQGASLGTLCVIDRVPRALSAFQKDALRSLSKAIVQLFQRYKLERSIDSAIRIIDAENTASIAGVLAVDKPGKIHFANRVVHEMFGYDQGALLGRNLDCLLPVEIREGHPAMIEDYFQAPTRRLLDLGRDLFALRKDGSRLPVEIGLCPIEGQGPQLVQVSIVDATARFEAALAEKQEVQQERLRTTELVVAGVGHQINNPLAYVLANVDYSLKTLVEEHQEFAELEDVCDALTDALEGAHRIREVVEALGSFSRTKRSSERLDVEPIIRVCAERLQAHCTLPVLVSVQPCPQIVANAQGLQQALSNTLLNASQAFALPDPGAAIEVRARLGDDGGVLIEVEDNGRGIGREARTKIFEPFYTTQSAGVGLGLFVAHHLVRASGGSIEVESELGEGSCFTLRFPPAT